MRSKIAERCRVRVEIGGVLSAVLTEEPGNFREPLQHMFYRPAAMLSYTRAT